MMWVILILVATVIIWKVVSAYDQYQRNHFIPDEELWEKYLRSDEYVPWSYKKRMMYYDRKKRKTSPYIEPKRPYSSYIETGYIHRRF